MKSLKTIFISLALIVMSFSFVSFAFAADGMDQGIIGNCGGAPEYGNAVGACTYSSGATCGTNGTPTATGTVSVAGDKSNCGCVCMGSLTGSIGVDQTPLPTIIGNIIKIILGLSGLVALVFVIWGGVQIAVSQGDEKAIKAAKDRMISGAVGIIIISSAYAISDFVIKAISRV